MPPSLDAHGEHQSGAAAKLWAPRDESDESPKNPWIPWVFDDEILWWMEILHQSMEGLSQLMFLFTV